MLWLVCMHGSSFFLGKVTTLGVLCCFALFVCLTLLASFFNMDVGYTVAMSVGRVCSVKVRSEKNGVGETARSKRMNSAFLRRRSMATNWR